MNTLKIVGIIMMTILLIPIVNQAETLEEAGKKTLTLTQKNRRPMSFIKDTTGNSSLRLSKQGKPESAGTIYYLRGVKSDATKYVSTGKLQVSFGKEMTTSYENFAAANGLEFIKEINQLYHTALYRVLDDSDIIELSNKLNLQSDVRYAKPDWIAPRATR